jgi:hypothetical protein
MRRWIEVDHKQRNASAVIAEAHHELYSGGWAPSGKACDALGRAGCAIRPGGDADTVAGAVGEDPADWGVGIVDNAAAGCQRRGQALLGLFAGDGYVDVHRVTQGLGWVEALHPNRRSMAKWVNGVVVRQANRGRPEIRILDLEPAQRDLVPVLGGTRHFEERVDAAVRGVIEGSQR